MFLWYLECGYSLPLLVFSAFDVTSKNKQKQNFPTLFTLRRHLFPTANITMFLYVYLCMLLGVSVFVCVCVYEMRCILGERRYFIFFFSVIRTFRNLYPQLFWITLFMFALCSEKSVKQLKTTENSSFSADLSAVRTQASGKHMEMNCNNPNEMVNKHNW